MSFDLRDRDNMCLPVIFEQESEIKSRVHIRSYLPILSEIGPNYLRLLLLELLLRR
jgi:hypothetical protein